MALNTVIKMSNTYDDVEMLTSEMHDPYTRMTVSWKIEQHKNAFKGHRCGAGQAPSEG